MERAIHAFKSGVEVKKLCRKFRVTPVELYRELRKRGETTKRIVYSIDTSAMPKLTKRNWWWAFSMRNPTYVAWRTAVLERCEYQCQLCGGCQSRRLHAHHIKKKSQYPELAFDPMNGIMLCKRCHMKIVDKREDEFEKIFTEAVALLEPVPYNIFVFYNKEIMGVEPVMCGCGCGRPTNFSQGKYKKFVFGHRSGR